MKSRVNSLLIAAGISLAMFAGNAFAQAPTMPIDEQSDEARLSLTVPQQDQTLDQVEQDSLAGVTLPLWPYWVISQADSRLYRGVIVGNPPGRRGPDADGGTTIPVYIVPIIFSIYDSQNRQWVQFDPTVPDPVCSDANRSPLALTLASPLFVDSPMRWGNTNLGNSQYIDALLRGEFWAYTQRTPLPWHNKLRPFTVRPIRLWFNGPGGGVKNSNCLGGKIGQVNRQWFDLFVQRTLLPMLRSQGVSTKVIPLFLTYNVRFNDTVGYHLGYGSPLQTYAVAPFDTTGAFPNVHDITVISHELGEVVNDPAGVNWTPAWGHIGQVQNGCQNNFEVGDPLSDPMGVKVVTINLNQYNYHPQELAFWSWFFRPAFNPGVNGWYSSNNSLVNNAGPVCR